MVHGACRQAAMPVIGYFNSAAPEGFSGYLRALRQGFKESGYVEGENVAIEYRWGENQAERLPELAADLVRRQVKVIAALDEPLEREPIDRVRGKRYSRQTPLRDVVPALNGRASLARARPCRTGAASFMAARARDHARQWA
jgi:hypothetical protein